MAQRGHVAEPRGPTRTHVGAYMGRRINWAKSFGPTDIVVPGMWIGGHTKV